MKTMVRINFKTFTIIVKDEEKFFQAFDKFCDNQAYLDNVWYTYYHVKSSSISASSMDSEV